MSPKKIFSFILFFTFSIVFGQALDDFSRLQSEGSIPKDFTDLSSKKYQYSVKTNQESSLDKEFFLSTHFFIDELLLSGKVLFNDPVSNYVSDVAGIILKNRSELKDSLRFYTIRSSIANAFSTDQGIVFVTTGLIGRLENEAQLAFILAHEISHFTQKHARKSYVVKKSLSNGKYGNVSYDEMVHSLSKYSQNNEFEADLAGYELYSTTSYSKEAALSALDLLLYSDQPMSDLEFRIDLFNTEYLKIPQKFPATHPKFNADEFAEDDELTHPNIGRRKENIKKNRTLDSTNLTQTNFILSEERFNTIKTLCQFETINTHMNNCQYVDALYEVIALKKRMQNRFLDLCELKCFYGIAKFKNRNAYDRMSDPLREYYDGLYLMNYVFKHLTKDQVNVIAYRKIYDLSSKYHNDSTFQLYKTDFDTEFVEYVDYLFLRSEDPFKKTNQNDSTDADNAISDLSNDYDPRYSFHFYALRDIVQEGLIDSLNLLKLKLKEEKETVDKIEKIVAVDPRYENYTIKKKKNFLRSEKKKLDFGLIYQEDYKNIGVSMSLLDPKSFDSTDIDAYNDFALINDWFYEIIAKNNVEMFNSNHEQMTEIKEKYGTSCFLYSGVFSYKLRHKWSNKHWAMVGMLYFTPLAIADIIIIHNYFQYVTIFLNTEDDSIRKSYVADTNLKGHKRVIQAYFYDMLTKLNSTGK